MLVNQRVHSRSVTASAILALTLLATVAGCGPSRPSPSLPLPPSPGASGYEFQSEDTQALQNDSFANPGLLWIDRGAQLWHQPPTPEQPSCSQCHQAAEYGHAMSGVATRYPIFDEHTKRPLLLEQRINRCRVEQQQQPAYQSDSDELLALTGFVAYQSRGQPLPPLDDLRLAPALAAGQRYFQSRRGQLNLSCEHCHVRYVGRLLRGDRLSHGHSNGYPLYRLEWQSLGSLQRRLRLCNAGIRAQPLPYDAAEYIDLAVYLRWRAAGLLVESPAVRR